MVFLLLLHQKLIHLLQLLLHQGFMPIITVTNTWGLGDDLKFQEGFKEMLVKQGYDVNGVNQAVFSAPIMGQQFNPDTLTLTIGTRQ